MTFEVKIVKDSRSPDGVRLTTMALKYPRFIHAELMTHRAFSRNASSSRAIPVERLVRMALEDPAFFVHIGANEKGMQAGGEVNHVYKDLFQKEWKELAEIAARFVRRWSDEYGIHKQVANRAMEPWHHITTLVSATDWDNFFGLRCHPKAQPEFQHLAYMMRHAYDDSVIDNVEYGDWHLPFVSHRETKQLSTIEALKASAARCARTSYMNHDGTNPVLEKDIKLHDDLRDNEPPHASPFEHQATPTRREHPVQVKSNFRGWTQYRAHVEMGMDWLVERDAP